MRNVLAGMFGLWAIVAAITSGLVVGTFGVLPFAALPRGRRERWAMYGAQLWAKVVLRGVLLARPRITGRWELPDGQGAILFCNHRSWLDPLLLMALTRSNGLSKAEIFWIPVIGLFGHLAGAVFFDRRDVEARHRARREVLKLVAGGHRIQVFPEGTRSRTGRLREKVFLTLAHDAHLRGIPVVPCAILGSERVLPPGKPLAWPLQEVRLDIGHPLQPADHDDPHSFARACWEAVKAQVAALEAQSNVSALEARDGSSPRP